MLMLIGGSQLARSGASHFETGKVVSWRTNYLLMPGTPDKSR
jgi:hypothetical protein